MMIFGNCYINKKVWLVILICGFLSLYIGLNGINPNYMALAKPDNETQVTHHTLGIYDEEMNYSATVGFIPIVDQKSQTEQARI
ncbi:MAG TPA: hypothetical protein GX009_05535, partial [Candidatus Atribacteria bacterium]|nr:hypothetical protein [Candidatus Atribacteria bacterium]